MSQEHYESLLSGKPERGGRKRKHTKVSAGPVLVGADDFSDDEPRARGKRPQRTAPTTSRAVHEEFSEDDSTSDSDSSAKTSQANSTSSVSQHSDWSAASEQEPVPPRRQRVAGRGEWYGCFLRHRRVIRQSPIRSSATSLSITTRMIPLCAHVQLRAGVTAQI